MRTFSVVLAALAPLLVTARASADIKMKWDCYLPSTSIDCVVLESSLTSKIPFLVREPDARDADVVVTLTSIPAEDGVRFKIDFEGKKVDGYATEVHAIDKIPFSIDTPTATVRLMTKLEQGLGDFMDQKIAAEVKDGKLTLQLLDPVRPPFAGRRDQEGVKWYVAPGAGTYFSDVEGVGVNASGNASVSFNWSEARWRLQQSIGASYSHQSQPVPGTSETASISFAGGSANDVFARSLTSDNKWSLGLLFAAEKNPQANYAMRANGSAGVEFDLVPRQTVNQKNLGARCALGPELQRYDATNTEGADQQLLARQFCDAFVGWHFVPVDVWASVSETTLVPKAAHWSFSASLSATWRITDSLTLSPWVNLQEIHEAINEARPVTTVYADPRAEIEASMRAAVQQGFTAPFGVQSGFSVRYVFGNGSLSSEDQRWKGVSNLR